MRSGRRIASHGVRVSPGEASLPSPRLFSGEGGGVSGRWIFWAGNVPFSQAFIFSILHPRVGPQGEPTFSGACLAGRPAGYPVLPPGDVEHLICPGWRKAPPAGQAFPHRRFSSGAAHYSSTPSSRSLGAVRPGWGPRQTGTVGGGTFPQTGQGYAVALQCCPAKLSRARAASCRIHQRRSRE
jgi:hypothetical protein